MSQFRFILAVSSLLFMAPALAASSVGEVSAFAFVHFGATFEGRDVDHVTAVVGIEVVDDRKFPEPKTVIEWDNAREIELIFRGDAVYAGPGPHFFGKVELASAFFASGGQVRRPQALVVQYFVTLRGDSIPLATPVVRFERDQAQSPERFRGPAYERAKLNFTEKSDASLTSVTWYNSQPHG